MLSPYDGVTLIDALTPPVDCELDIVVGTSFTLDLVALLAVPTAFALCPGVDQDNPHEQTPLGLLEALRTHTGRMTVFTDQAHIALPSTRESTVLGFLDDVVVPVKAPRSSGLFHPKIWVLRYRINSGGHLHRVLIPTRNLTFDRSWDTLARLDEIPADAPNSPATTLPELGELLRALPALASGCGPAPERNGAISQLAATVAGARFSIPTGFDDMRLHLLGFDDAPTPFPLPTDARRTLVVSPFLGTRIPAPIRDAHHLTIVSRSDELDTAFQTTAETGRPAAFTLNPNLVDADSDDLVDDVLDDAGTELHAKLFVHDLPTGRTSVFTGSANATEAAFGRNTEVLLELGGPTTRVGVYEFVKESRNKSEATSRLSSVLVPHTWSEPKEPDEKDADSLRTAQTALADVRVVATVSELREGLFQVEYSAADPLPYLQGATLEIRPISYATWQRAHDRLHISVRVALPQITRFLGVKLSLNDAAPLTFVIPCELVGAPGDRSDRLLTHLIADPERLVRYLLMLLTDSPEDRFNNGIGDLFEGFHRTGGDLTTFPLLEMMLRAVTEAPDRLLAVGRLMGVVREHSTLAHPSLLELWDAVAGLLEEAE